VSAGGPTAALLALGAALLLWRPPGATRRARVRDLLPAADPRGRRRVDSRSGDPPGARRRWAWAGLAGTAVLALLGGGPVAALTGAGVAVLTERLVRRAGGPREDDVGPDLPVACDLLGVCLAAGTPIGAAVAAVAGSLPGPLGSRLDQVGAMYRLGAAPRQAWSGVPPPVAPLARVLVRAGESGSGVVPALHRLAADLRTAQRGAVEASVRRAGVWVLAPLGVCFLPAFLCLGVVPMVLGIAADVFG
jgi:Flp pilus assembly protein TadB